MKKRIVVIGGGFAGVEVSARLESDYDVTLIDQKEYFECNVGVPIAITEPDYLKQMTVSYRELLQNVNIVTSEVTEVTAREVHFEGGTLLFDYLVIASGARYYEPIKPSEERTLAQRKETLKQYHQRLGEANSVLVIGGGSVGVEIATEIIANYPQKKLTLLESSPHLLSRLHKQGQEYAETFLRDRGATLLLNERLERKEENSYITNKGTKVKADIEFNCTGIQPNTAFLAKYFPEHLDERKRIKVNQYLQLSGYENIFAIGDCTNVKEEKLAINAKRHATLVLTNISCLERHLELHPYKISKLFTSLISCGRSHAIMATPWFAIGGFIPGQFKGMEVPMLMKTLTWSYPQFFWEFY